MLIDFYARCNNIDTPTASRIIREFLEEMRHVLETKKSIVFPGLGKLRATKENYFFFVADEDLDIYPEGFGLEPISLKTHEKTPAEVSATMAALRSILNPEEAETATAETAEAEEVQQAERRDGDSRGRGDDNGTSRGQCEGGCGQSGGSQGQCRGCQNGGRRTNASETETKTAGIEEAAPAEANTEEVEVNANEPATEEINAPAEVNAPAEPTGDNATPAGDNPVNDNDLAANVETAENTESETSATTVQATSQKPAGSKIWQVIKWTVIILVILAVTALLTFIILAHIAPGLHRLHTLHP